MKPIVLLAGLLCSVLAWCQDPQLFKHTWYLQDVTVSGTTYPAPNNEEVSEVPTTFRENDLNFQTDVCNTFGGSLEYNDPNQTFTFIESGVTLIVCDLVENINFEMQYFNNFYVPNAENDFAYEITGAGDTKQLVLTVPNGDQAVYGNQILSIHEQDLVTISIHPNPVVAEVQIDAGIAIHEISVYDVLGQQVTYKLFNEPSSFTSFDLTSLKSGLYFVELKDTKGRGYIERLVKR